MVKTTVNKVDNGVDINFVGSVEKSKIETMVGECSSGKCSCSCDTDMMSKIDGMSVDGINGDVTIHLKGNSLNKNEIETAVNGCLTEEEK